MTSSNVQSNTTCLTNTFVDLGLHVSIHYGIIIRPSLKYTDPLHKIIKIRFGIPTFTLTFVYGVVVNIVRYQYQ